MKPTVGLLTDVRSNVYSRTKDLLCNIFLALELFLNCLYRVYIVHNKVCARHHRLLYFGFGFLCYFFTSPYPVHHFKWLWSALNSPLYVYSIAETTFISIDRRVVLHVGLLLQLLLRRLWFSSPWSLQSALFLFSLYSPLDWIFYWFRQSVSLPNITAPHI